MLLSEMTLRNGGNDDFVKQLTAYNHRSEVTNAAMAAATHSYAYDDIGNRQTSSVNAVPSTYTANSLNQYTAITGGLACSPEYDLDGNMTWDGKFSHTWDGENRRIRSEPGETVTNGSVMVENIYDYQNRRFKKLLKRLSGRGAGYPLDPNPPGTWNIIETRLYVWDGWNIAAEIVIDSLAGSTNIHYYTWGLDLSGSIQGAGGVGGLLADTKVSASTTATYFPCYDANGNVTEYLDDAGTVRGHYEYSAFGEITTQAGDLADTFTHRFSTKPFEAETGVSKYQQRDNISPLGRRASRDPLEEEGGILLYGFIVNQAVNYVDRLGFSKWSYVELSAHEGHNAGCGEWNRKDEGFSGKGNQQSYIKHFEIEVLGNSKAAFLKMPYRVKRPMAEEIVEKIGVPKDDNKTLWAMNLGKSVLFYKPIASIADSTCSSGRRCARDVYFKGEVTKLEKFDSSVPLIIYPPKGSITPERKFVETGVYSIQLECTK